MRDPELVARAGYAAARLEQAWERWRALHGLGGSSDPLASYVGYSHKEPMGEPRVVIGVDAAEAEYFADFLESHECAGVANPEPRPVNGLAHLPVGGSGPAPRDAPSEPMARMAGSADPGALTGPERAAMNGPGSLPVSATQVFHQAPVVPGHPHDPRTHWPPSWRGGRRVSCRARRQSSWPSGARPNRPPPGPSTGRAACASGWPDEATGRSWWHAGTGCWGRCPASQRGYRPSVASAIKRFHRFAPA